MARIDILYKGYYFETEQGEQVCSTVTLVLGEEDKLRIIVDPGTLPDPSIVLRKLDKHGLIPDDINIVFITHSHLDHHRYTGMFPKAAVLDSQGWWLKDTWRPFTVPLSIGDNIEVIRTPGHSEDSLTLLVNTGQGRVAICGDVFWDKDYPVEDPFASDKVALQESRERLKDIADFIIPGHGDIFAT